MKSETIRRFGAECRDFLAEMQGFFAKTKAFRYAAAFFTIMLYGMRAAQPNIFVDSEIMMNEPEAMLGSWCGIGRFGLVFTSRLLSVGRLIPTLSGLLLLPVLWCLTVFLVFSLYHWSGEEEQYRKGACIFALVFLSAPCFAEQFLFSLQAVEVALAMCFCSASVFAAGKWIYEKKSILWLFLAYLLLVWALGTYQAFVPWFIAWTSVSFITVYLSGKHACGLKEAFWFILLFAAGLVSYYLLGNFVAKCAGADSAYVDAMFLWGKQTLAQSLDVIKIDFNRIYFGGWPTFFKRGYRIVLPVFAVLVTAAAVSLRPESPRRVIWLLCALGILALSPLMLTLATAMNQPIRGQLTYPLACAYEVMFLYVGFGLLRKRWPSRSHLLCFCSVLACCFGLYFGWRQSVAMCQLWETAYEGYMQDVRLAEQIYDKICQVGGGKSRAVAFTGTHSLKFYGPVIPGDVIGHSWFEWDSTSAKGVSERACSFMRTLGMGFEYPTVEEYETAVEQGAEKPAWPAEGSVFMIGDVACVKLSE